MTSTSKVCDREGCSANYGGKGTGKSGKPFKEFSYAQCLSFLLATNADVAKSNV